MFPIALAISFPRPAWEAVRMLRVQVIESIELMDAERPQWIPTQTVCVKTQNLRAKY